MAVTTLTLRPLTNYPSSKPLNFKNGVIFSVKCLKNLEMLCTMKYYTKKGHKTFKIYLM